MVASLVLGVAALIILGFTVREMRTSALQARWLAPIAAELTWTVEPGPSSSIVFPGDGPYDLRLGYARLPDMISRAETRGYRVAEQARVSERFADVVSRHGLFPIYRAKSQAGFSIVDRAGVPLFSNPYPERVYPEFEAIPPIVWQTLLFIENRTILDPDRPFQNPAVEWPRLFRSTFDLGLRYLGREGSVAGASTLATQLEKFRHAPDGLTESPMDKLAQMATASLRGYMDGPETLPARRQIVLDYVNSVPLAAQRGEGEVTGLGDGLRAWYGRDFREANRILASVQPNPSSPLPTPERVLPPGSVPAIAFWDTPVETDAGGIEGENGPGQVVLESGAMLAGEGAEGSGLPNFVSIAGSDDGAVRPSVPTSLEEQGRVYREILSLLISQRRPSYYLTRPEGREALEVITDRYLGLLLDAGVLTEELAGAAMVAPAEIRIIPPERPPVSFIERKGVNAVRTQLLGTLGLARLYDLDRLDLTVRTTLDAPAQRTATDFLVSLADPQFVQERGFNAARMLDRGDPGLVIYSLVLHERTERGNLVRIQTDNLDAPFNLNESARLELGSTAKLRTLASYLEVIADVHDRFSGLAPDSLRSLPLSSSDNLSLWVRGQVLNTPDADLETVLRRSMQRSYSANPAQQFVTGGGVQSFTNFDNTYDQQSLTVLQGFRHSVNLVFVRMMRDVVNHYIYRVPGSTAHVLDEPDSPLRQEYLERFADREGIQFIDQFIPKFRDRSRSEILQALVSDRMLTPQRTAWVYRTVAVEPTLEEFEFVLRVNQPEAEFAPATIRDVFERANPEGQNLQDLGFLASVHPLELWVARYFIENPGATRAEIIGASAEARQEVYTWLFRTSRQGAQDQRIRSLMEVEAFTEILAGWRRLGYPFENIVPSLGTSIGSSGDRPAALGELVGIILNDGVRLPTYQVEELQFARGTPFETSMDRVGDPGEVVMVPEVATVLREALVDVVEEGTARRMRGVLRSPDGSPLTVGGKTGTGDNRYRVFGAGGRLIESRSVNRTSTFVFFIEDRFYGVVSAYVPGADADRYWFTSALPTQILRELSPVIEGLMAEPAGVSDPLSPSQGAGMDGPEPGAVPTDT
jgi:membrane peptidoglycan carboxypeptidase